METAIDYRSSAWRLRDALASDAALARLEARPIAPENRAALAVATFEIDRRAKRRAGQELVDAGFRYVGTKIESASYVMRDRTDVFVDADETTYVAVRRRRSLLPSSLHYLYTFFEDGSCIQTVGRIDPLYRSDGPLLVRAGTGSLACDLEGHFTAVRERARSGIRVLAVRGGDGTVRLARFELSHVFAPGLAMIVARARETERDLAAIALTIIALVCLAFVGR
ncbi:MAG: hypothetical protein ACRELY_13295 [Polyangiaceae bacterium]